jgi:MFS family permease
MIRAQDIQADKAGLLVGVMGLLGVVGAILGGMIADRWQKTNPRARMLVPAIAMILSTVCMVAAFFFNIQGIGYILACVWGVLSASTLPPLIAVTQDVTPLDKRGQAWGLNIFLANLLGAAWAPMLIGLLSDALGAGAFGLKVALLISTSCGFIAGILFFLSAKHYPSDAAKIGQLVIEEK